MRWLLVPPLLISKQLTNTVKRERGLRDARLGEESDCPDSLLAIKPINDHTHVEYKVHAKNPARHLI